MKRILSALLALLLLLPLAACSQKTQESGSRDLPDVLAEVHENFDRDRCYYSFLSDDPSDTRQRMDLEEETVAALSTEEVLRAVMEYPRLIDLMAYDSPREAAEHVSRRCTALRVFLQREDARAALAAAQKDVYAYTGKVETDKTSKAFFPIYLEVLRRALENEPF
mgnify:FL=1